MAAWRVSRMPMLRLIFSFALLFVCTAQAFAAPPNGNDLVKAELLADVGAIEPGKPFTVGVLFKIAPGWHVYWKNAGDAGTPAEVKFDLPTGFRVTETQYPVPERIEAASDIIEYGYSKQVM